MERQPYPTDLTDAQWEKIAPLIIPPQTRGITGRPREIPYREIVNALFYQAKAGGGWRLLPHDFPKWQTVTYYFRIWTLMGLLQEIHDRLREEVRLKEGRVHLQILLFFRECMRWKKSDIMELSRRYEP